MSVHIPNVDHYLIDGCGRCDHYSTPKCKVNAWRHILIELRALAIESGLSEEIKWGVPVYTYQGKNVFNISAFKDFACLGFYKGVLLKDNANILLKQGESSQSGRIIKFTELVEVTNNASTILDYMFEAIELEKSGAKVITLKNPEPMPTELEETLVNDIELATAFYHLTPGRQRGYIIYFSQPKQSTTRLSRIQAKRQNIINGEGMHDKYQSKN
jgi:uncharacterized protein YdeI (YjbR/CyaY-like superfamily)